MTELYQNFLTAAGAISAIVLNALWQDALLVICVWLLLRVWPRVNASTRYIVWSATLGAALVVPVVTTLLYFTPAQAMRVQTGIAHQSQSAGTAPQQRPPATRSAPTIESRPAAPAAAPGLPQRYHVMLPVPLTLAVFGIWLALAIYALVRLTIGLVRLEQLKRDALPLPVEYRDSMPQWLSANKGTRDVRLCVSDETDVPVAVGLFDAMILIPRTLLDHLSEPEVDQICLHELAHLRRADDWSNGVQRVIEALLGWNPAAQFVGQQLDLEREVACDDWVLSFVGKVRPYALCLTKMAETASWPRNPIPAPGVFATRKHISLRIERLLGAGRNIATNLSLGPAAVAAAVMAAIVVLIGVVAPTVAAPVVVAPAVAPVAVKAVTPSRETPIHRVAHAPVHSVTIAKHLSLATVPASAPKPAFPALPKPAAPTAPRVASRADAVATNARTKAESVEAYGEAAAQKATEVEASAMPAVGDIVKRVSSMLPATVVAQSSSGKACSGCNYSGVNWQGRDLRNVSYTGVDFRGANLAGANLAGSSLSGVDFTSANLSNVSFRNARLTGCDFTNANLTGSDFTGAKMTGCQFRNASLGSAQMRDVLNHCSGCDFSHASMSGLDLRGVRANGDDFSGADLRNVNFAGAELVGIDFGNAKMDGVNLNGATLNGCDLSGVDLSRVDLSKTKMIGTDFSKQRSPR